MVKEHMKLTPEQILQNEMKVWTRSAPADLYYQRDLTKPNILRATDRLTGLLFQTDVLDKSEIARKAQVKYQPPKTNRLAVAKCRPSRGCCGEKKHQKPVNTDHGGKSSDEDEDSSSSDEENGKVNEKEAAKDEAMEWLEHRYV
jgi:ribonuclease-3